MNDVYLLLGSNVGNRFLYLVKALLKIDRLNDTRILEISSFYETEPYGYKNQNDFVNLVVKINTNFEPGEFLSKLKAIELEIGRKPGARWSEREIDIDILFYGSEIINSEELTVPHYDLSNRRFVLEPLNEIASELVHPILKKKISTLLNELNDDTRVKKIL